jgi:hypothetical protein
MFAVAIVASSISIAMHAADVKAPAKVTVADLGKLLAESSGQPDADLARRLVTYELTERLDPAATAKLQGTLPGEKSRQALLALADRSQFLAPPVAELPADPTPDAAQTRQMLVRLVNYVNTTMRQLPNLLADRSTMGFADQPLEDVLEATGTVTHSAQPLHLTGKGKVTVTYRDHGEVIDESAWKVAMHGIGGLESTGEFGPILNVVVGDALKGKITWARWESGAAGQLAVFHFAVPEDKSNYRVRFCCTVDGYDGQGLPELRIFDERSAYHGEIAFNPADGSILSIVVVAEMPPKGLVAQAGMMVQYGPVEIGGKSYICPLHSVSVLASHQDSGPGTKSRANYRGPLKSYLNDVTFSGYRRFGAEVKILP